jgi:hypothetical protein
MSYRAEPLMFRAGSSTSALRTLPCRWCGRPAGEGKGDILHQDLTAGGTSWGEHPDCRSRPRRDWLAPQREWRLP